MDLTSAVKREETTDTGNYTMDPRGTRLMSGPVSKGYMLSSSAYMAFLRRPNYTGRTMSGCGVGVGVGSLKRRAVLHLDWGHDDTHPQVREKLQTRFQTSACDSGDRAVRRVDCIHVTVLMSHQAPALRDATAGWRLRPL